MIQLNCTNCRELLTIDEAFAGGACRCRHCGTIQTVPKRLKTGDAPGSSGVLAQAASGAKPAKSLYKRKSATAAFDNAGSGTGLDDLAEIVASSGLSSGRLQQSNSPAVPAARPAVPARDKKLILIVSAAAAVIALLLAIIIVMAVRDKTHGTADDAAPHQNTTPVAPAIPSDAPRTPPKTPLPFNAAVHFLNQPIAANSVVYVLDRNASTKEGGRLDLIKAAVLQSVRSLGAARKFQVIFWQVGDQPPEVYPPDGLAPATEQHVARLATFLDDVYHLGQTSVPLDLVFRHDPEAVVLVPVKVQLDDTFRKSILTARKDSTAKVYCVTLDQPNIAPELKRLAAETNGAYKNLTLPEAKETTKG